MARTDEARFVLKGTLEAVTPIHIGGGSEPGLDSVPFRDGVGRLTLPGAGLTGAIRERAIARGWEKPEVEKIFGDTDGHGASRLVVHDLLIEGDPVAEVRQGVGIDRITGAAAEHIKFDRSILPVGTRLKLEISLSGTSELAHQMRNIKEWLESGEFRVGAGRSRGLGKVKLIEAALTKIDLTKVAQLLGREDAEAIVHTASTEPAAGPDLRVTICWTPLTPVFSKAADQGTGVDTFPLTTTRGSGPEQTLHLLMPGTSIRGALRARAEHIVRTVRGTGLTTKGEPTEWPTFMDQIAVDVVTDLFGSTKTRGAVSIDDVLSHKIAEGDKVDAKWRAAMDAKKDATRLVNVRTAIKRLCKVEGHTFIPSPKIAIDRWTGAPVDGALFAVLEPHCVTWDPIVIDVDFRRIAEAPAREQAIALLLITLDEFSNGAIPLGYGANRGYGSLKVTGIQSEAKAELQCVADALAKAPHILDELDQKLRVRLKKNWPQKDSSDEETAPCTN